MWVEKLTPSIVETVEWAKAKHWMHEKLAVSIGRYNMEYTSTRVVILIRKYLI